jgi:hypothetical protein
VGTGDWEALGGQICPELTSIFFCILSLVVGSEGGVEAVGVFALWGNCRECISESFLTH